MIEAIPILPKLMVAPNGARRTKADHAAIPVTITEIVETAKRCFEAGATGLHAHVRDAEENHVLDAGFYRELIVEMGNSVPDMQVQITTEAVGVYSPAHQRKVVRDVMPECVSVGLIEMLSDGDENAARKFYHFALESKIAVQHIVYDSKQLAQLVDCVARGIIPSPAENTPLQLMFVLGRYTKDQQSDPEGLLPYLVELKNSQLTADWAVCAFGRNETACLSFADKHGGCLRVGFENSIWNDDGSVARDNVERVMDVKRKLTINAKSG